MEHKKQSKLIVAIATAVLFFVFSGIIGTGSALASLNVPQINRDLNLGSVGDDVKNLQQFLNNTGYAVAAAGSGSPGQETYYFGALTQSALKKFQTAQGINANGIVDQATRELLIRLSGQNGTSNIKAAANAANTGTTSAMLAQIELLKKQIAALQEQLKAMISDSDDKNDEAPQISDIVINNGGDDGYIDNGDTIKITFDRAIDPESINSSLEKGGSVQGLSYSKTGGVSVSSSGLVTIKNIAKFDIGSVKNSGNFTAKIALSSTGKVLTVTLTGGNDIEISDEDFDNAEQLGNSVEDEDGNPMENDDIDTPSGTFGGAKTETEVTVSCAAASTTFKPGTRICCSGLAIAVAVDGCAGITATTESARYACFQNTTYTCKATTNTSSTTNSTDSSTCVAANGTINGTEKTCCAGLIKTYTNTTRVPANCNPEIGIACTSIIDNYICKSSTTASGASCVAENGTIIDNNNICCSGLTKTYIGQTRIPAGCGPTTDNGNGLTCTSITSNYACKKPATTTGTSTGNTTNTASCAILNEVFKPGTKICCSGLNITVAADGCAGITATTETERYACFQNTTYTCKAAITSSNSNSSSQTAASSPEIASILITAGNYNVSNESDYYYTNSGTFSVGSVGIGDTIAITFDEAIDPASISSSLIKGGSISGIGASSIGGISVTSAGLVKINGIASFDIGSVNTAANFTSKLSLDSTGKILTIAITNGNSNISNENYGSLTQIADKIKSALGTAMGTATKSNVLSGTFGFASYNYQTGVSTTSYTESGTTSYTNSGNSTGSNYSWDGTGNTSESGSWSGSSSEQDSYNTAANLGNLDNDNYIYSSYLNSGTSTSYNYSSLADTGGSYGGWVPAF